MAINVKTTYPDNADAASLDYPTGSFKNDSTPSSEDGTPLEVGWMNDFLGSRDAVLLEGGVTASGDPDTAQASDFLDALKNIASKNTPIGSLLIMDGNVVPEGFLKRNGAELLRASYPLLWSYAQTVSNYVAQVTKDGDPEAYAGYYGSGDGSTTFTIPDWRGEFWRAWDDGRGVDAGRGIGTWQADEIKAHTHTLNTTTSTDGDVAGQVERAEAQVPQTQETSSTGGIETRPRSLAAMALVRAY